MSSTHSCPLCQEPLKMIERGEHTVLMSCQPCARGFVYERSALAAGVKHSANPI